jgi:multiple antibiotic resistance protein
MHEYISFSITVFLGFLAIMNPIANAPIFMGITAEDDESTRKKVALKSVFIAFIIVMICSAAGKMIFELFGISLTALRLTGGILVFIIGYHMLNGDKPPMQHSKPGLREKSRDAVLDQAVSPLAIPILAGPGTIATAMNFSAKGDYLYIIITIAAFALLCMITYVSFLSGQKLLKVLGASFINVITKIMGLILAVIGTQMFIEGVKGVVEMVMEG